jgi:hypothetical protein
MCSIAGVVGPLVHPDNDRLARQRLEGQRPHKLGRRGASSHTPNHRPRRPADVAALRRPCTHRCSRLSREALSLVIYAWRWRKRPLLLRPLEHLKLDLALLNLFDRDRGSV